jgi:16S rRNA (guanine527-N7)-methyltransferase
MHDLLASGLSQFNLELPAEILQTEIAFLDELLRWNGRVNLTSIINKSVALEKHLIDSLALLPYLEGAKNLIDLGSGGGLPGIPLAIAGRSLQVVSVDSVGKKINFQKHIKRLFSLENLTVIQSRAENLNQTLLVPHSYDLVVARAFTSLELILEYAASWLTPGGRVMAMKGPQGRLELQAAKEVMNRYGFDSPVVYSYTLPHSHGSRELIVFTMGGE